MAKPTLRTKSIGFKVSEEEYVRLGALAEQDGQTLGEWCRVRHLSDSVAEASADAPTQHPS